MSRAGGIGLGLVAGWLVASVPSPRGRGVVGVLLVVPGAVTAEAALLAGDEAAVGCVAGMAVGFALRRGLDLVGHDRGGGS